MDESPDIEPFGFFTVDSLRAGWYLTWRLLLRVAIGAAAAGVAGSVLSALRRPEAAAALITLGVTAAAIWAAVLVPRVTIQWAEQWYGATLSGRLRIWWGVTWRVLVVSLVAAVICTPPEFVALSLKTAFPGSTLGMVGSGLSLTLGVLNIGVSIVAAGWAMSKVAVEQIARGEASVGDVPLAAASDPLPPASPERGFAPVATAGSAPSSPSFSAGSVAAALVEPARVERRAPAAAPTLAADTPAAAPHPAPAGERRQCPKCGLHETERGSVIGWYCKVCGWREARR